MIHSAVMATRSLAPQPPHEYDQPTLSTESNSIPGDWPCFACGYNLRGLLASSNCPECGHSAANSRQIRSLYFASPHWLKRIIWAFRMLVAVLLLNFAAQFLPFIHNIGRFFNARGSAILYPDDISRILLPLLLLPVSCLFVRRDPLIERRSWPVRFLPVLVLWHLIVSLAIPVLRQIITNAIQSVLFLAYGLEPFLFTAEFWFLLTVPINLSSRIPANPMRFEVQWFRRIFIPLLLIDDLFEFAVEIARIAYLRVAHAPTRYWLPAPWGAIAVWIEVVVYLLLIPLWLYLPVFYIRFSLTLRPALAWSSSHGT